jgi:CheY-like chemotaxis protein
MIEAAKLESLGVLAGGVAHDFNNLLTAVLGCASMVAEEAAKLSLSAEVQENLQIIQVAARRASDLCRQLLAYSGRGKFIVEPQSLSVLVEQTSKLLGASISKIIDLEFDLDPLLPRVLMDTTQVRQVLMNLVINAAEAIGESRGRIAISTGTMEFDGTQSYENFVGEQVSNGTYVYLRVEDTGSGILASEIPKIFEPFYSTKFTGRGLGLSAVLGIIRGHRGALEVKSKSGSGTIFTMYLPPDFGAAQESSDGPSIATWEGTGNVLVVDDESVVRSSLRRLLVNLGFEVDLACDGDEAIAVYRTNPGKYRLVVLDLTMPRRSGAETFAELKALDPTVRVLVMSGYHHSDATSNFSTDEIRGFLAKPFDRESLIAALQVALEP